MSGEAYRFEQYLDQEREDMAPYDPDGWWPEEEEDDDEDQVEEDQMEYDDRLRGTNL